MTETIVSASDSGQHSPIVEALADSLEEACRTLRDSGVCVGQVWQHVKKRAFYRIVKVGLYEKTMQPMVCYEPVGDDDDVWIRFIDDFLAIVEVDGRMTPRFVRVDD